MKLIFRPGRIVWVWALVLAAMASSTVAVAASSFGDVPDNHPYHDAIQWLYENGITEGCGGSNYCPDRDVTRGEIALLLQRLTPLQLDSQGERRDPHGDPALSVLPVQMVSTVQTAIPALSVPPVQTAQTVQTA